MRKLLIFTAALVAPLMAHAAAKPPELSSTIKATSPVGSATLKKLFIPVYDATFWSDTGGWNTPPYAITLTYAMSFAPDELSDRTLEEMKHVSDLPEATLRRYANLLTYPAVKDGDRITALQSTEATTVFFHNGKKVGVINDAGFAKVFFAIWLSPKSSEPDMQQRLTDNH